MLPVVIRVSWTSSRKEHYFTLLYVVGQYCVSSKLSTMRKSTMLSKIHDEEMAIAVPRHEKICSTLRQDYEHFPTSSNWVSNDGCTSLFGWNPMTFVPRSFPMSSESGHSRGTLTVLKKDGQVKLTFVTTSRQALAFLVTLRLNQGPWRFVDLFDSFSSVNMFQYFESPFE